MARVDVEGWLGTLLGSRLSLPVASKPQATATRFVVVKRTGGPAHLRMFDRPLVVVEAYGPTETKAIETLNAARDVLLSLRGIHNDVNVYSTSEVGGPGTLPDPLLPKLARYTATYELHLIGLRAA
ncbi:hypothetical protein [Isoptericola sp. NPDC056134]|uniref:hypothetical protein n=1 Tax=Isoptericola sp. NPDC056134 TaxID=3345723 RepID=UPI0035EB027D